MPYYPWSSHSDKCGWCGERLTGKQERYCETKCRVAAWRAGKNPRPEPRTCVLCGEEFFPRHKRQHYCDYFDDAERACKLMQDDLEEAADFAAEDRANALCEHCGESAGWTGNGRPRKFCSDRCKTAEYRARKRGTAHV